MSIQHWCLFQTSKYLMHIVKNCLVKERTMELWYQFLNIHNEYLRWLKHFFFSTNVKKIIMVFHKANKLSSNIIWIHSRTLNVIPYFHGRVACCATSVHLWHKWWTHVLSIRAKPSIIEHVLVTEQFPIFSTILNQIEWFSVLGCAN